MGANVKLINAATFDQEVLTSATPVLVDFSAAWCPPCHAMEPVLRDIAVEFGDRLKVTKIDVDENPDIAARYGVMSMPTFMVFKGGQPVERLVGAMPKKVFKTRLEPALG